MKARRHDDTDKEDTPDKNNPVNTANSKNMTNDVIAESDTAEKNYLVDNND